MTNEVIILNERMHLAEEGIIGYTGRTVTVRMADGENLCIEEPQEIHTYAEWHNIGMQVKRGEHAVAKFKIWQHTGRKKVSLPMEDGTEAEGMDHGHFFMAMAAFFSQTQVEPIA